MKTSKLARTKKRDGSIAGFTLLELIVCLAFVALIWWGVHSYMNRNAKNHTEQAVAESKKPFAIKGLYIGMTADEIPQAIQGKLDSTWHVYKHTDPHSLEIITDQLNPLIVKGDYAINVTFGNDLTVNSIVIGENCARLIFDSGGMEAEQFLQTFMNAYQIDRMEGGKGCWYYTTPDNVTVKVTTEKAVLLYKSADSQQIRANFN